jgi:HSP20 family molecular chaperone IbpA
MQTPMTETQTSQPVEKREQDKTLAAKKALPFVTPAIDVLQSEHGFLILADLPGVKPSDLEVQFDKDTLHVVGRRESAGYAYRRSFTLSRDIDPEGISAELADGVLTLTLPKHASRRPRSIQVKKAG